MQLGHGAVVAVLVDDAGRDVHERVRAGDVLHTVEHNRELPLDDPVQLVALVHMRERPSPTPAARRRRRPKQSRCRRG